MTDPAPQRASNFGSHIQALRDAPAAAPTAASTAAPPAAPAPQSAAAQAEQMRVPTPPPAAGPAAEVPAEFGQSDQPISSFGDQHAEGVAALDAQPDVDLSKHDTDAQQPAPEAGSEDVESVLDPDAATAEPETYQGVTQEALLQAMRDGTVPVELLEHLRVPVKINGEETLISLTEHSQSHMRVSDFSRKSRELAAERTTFEGIQTGFENMANAWRDKANAADTWQQLEDMGVPMLEVAQAYATHYDMMESMTPTERDAVVKGREQGRENARLQLENQQLKANGATSSQGQIMEHAKASLAKWMPSAFKKAGIPDGKTARSVFREHLRGLWDRDAALTQQVVQQAAQAAREELADMAKRYQAEQPPPAPAATTLPPTVAPTGSATPVKAKSMRANEFRAHMASLRR